MTADGSTSFRAGACRVMACAVAAQMPVSLPLSVNGFDFPPFFLQHWGTITPLVLLVVYAIIAFEHYRAARLKELNAALSVSQELTRQLALQQVELGRATRLLALDYAITCALVESATLTEAVLRILQTICIATGWDVGVISDIDSRSHAQRCLGVWHKAATNADDQDDADCDQAFLADTKLARHVLTSRQSYWISNLSDSDSGWPDSLDAIGTRGSGFGFPILVENEIIGILELYSHEVRQPDPELIHNLSSVGNHIGQLIKRRRAEDELRKSKEERLLELERVRRRIATDLHDDVGSSLTKIALLSEAVRQKVPENQDATDRLGTVIALSNELVEAMSDIVWAINPQKDCLSDLLQRMRRFASDIFTACQIAFRFHTPGFDQEIKLNASLRREIFLVFKESIHNIVKHSECSEVVLNLEIDRHCITLSINDNGKGFNPSLAKADTGYLTSQHRGGNGIASMRRRAREMSGHFEILTGMGRGTTITLSLPLKHEFRGVA